MTPGKAWSLILLAPQRGVFTNPLTRRTIGNNWGQVQEINPPDGLDSLFGSGVAVDGKTLMVGDTKNNAVYIFSRNLGGNTGVVL